MMLAVARPATAAPSPRSAPAALARWTAASTRDALSRSMWCSSRHGATARPDGRRGEDRVRDLGGQPAAGASYAPAAVVGDRREGPEPDEQQHQRGQQRQPENRVQQHQHAPGAHQQRDVHGERRDALRDPRLHRGQVVRGPSHCDTEGLHTVFAEVVAHQPYADLMDVALAQLLRHDAFGHPQQADHHGGGQQDRQEQPPVRRRRPVERADDQADSQPCHQRLPQSDEHGTPRCRRRGPPHSGGRPAESSDRDRCIGTGAPQRPAGDGSNDNASDGSASPTRSRTGTSRAARASRVASGDDVSTPPTAATSSPCCRSIAVPARAPIASREVNTTLSTYRPKVGSHTRRAVSRLQKAVGDLEDDDVRVGRWRAPGAAPRAGP